MQFTSQFCSFTSQLAEISWKFGGRKPFEVATVGLLKETFLVLKLHFSQENRQFIGIPGLCFTQTLHALVAMLFTNALQGNRCISILEEDIERAGFWVPLPQNLRVRMSGNGFWDLHF